MSCLYDIECDSINLLNSSFKSLLKSSENNALDMDSRLNDTIILIELLRNEIDELHYILVDLFKRYKKDKCNLDDKS